MRRMWALLDARERRTALRVLALMVLGALASAAMVGAIFPFLSVLADPARIAEVPALAAAYAAGGFTTDYGFLVALGSGAVVVIVLANLGLIATAWATARFTQMRVHSLSRRLLGHYLAQPYAFFLGRHTGDMATNILAEAQQVVLQYLYPLAQLISAALTVVAVVAMLVILDPVVALVTLATFGAIYGAVMAGTRARVRRLGALRAETNAARYRIAGEALGGVKDVKLLGHEHAYLERYSAPSVDMARTLVALSVLSHVPRYAIQIVAFGGLIVLCLALLDPAGLQDRAALGGLLPLIGVLAFAGQRLMPELQKLYHSATQMAAGAAALDRVHADLVGERAVAEPATGGRQTGAGESGAARGGLSPDRTAELAARSAPEPLPSIPPAPLGLRRELVLENVRYTYPGATRPGLDGVTLTLRAGARIGIVGASGAGKTTLADVILGLLSPQAGTIVADGTPLNAATRRAWQQGVGYVPQDIFLTDASLAENIALGVPPERIDSARLARAARLARLDGIVRRDLPQGYATPIGERGVRLSGGQRQRIGIARALYRDTDLIVFDEATSALDPRTEQEVMAALGALPAHTTLVLIAHRLTTVRACDQIVVMEAGRVAAVGPWDDLERTSRAFRRLTGLRETA